jgi:hypothetical protein
LSVVVDASSLLTRAVRERSVSAQAAEQETEVSSIWDALAAIASIFARFAINPVAEPFQLVKLASIPYVNRIELSAG